MWTVDSDLVVCEVESVVSEFVDVDVSWCSSVYEVSGIDLTVEVTVGAGVVLLSVVVCDVWTGLRWTSGETGVGGTGMAPSVECVDG